MWLRRHPNQGLIGVIWEEKKKSAASRGYWWWVPVDLAGVELDGAPQKLSMFQGWVVRTGPGRHCDNSALEISDGWPAPPAFWIDPSLHIAFLFLLFIALRWFHSSAVHAG